MKKTNRSSSSKKSRFEREQYLYLTTRGRRTGLPREIEIWFTSHDAHFYIIAEYETSNWVQNIRANSAVKVRVAGEELAAHARILSGETELELIRKVRFLSEKKYGWGDGLVVEITPDPAE